VFPPGAPASPASPVSFAGPAPYDRVMNPLAFARRRALRLLDRIAIRQGREVQALLLGRLLADSVKAKRDIASLRDVEFRVFSQYGDDGIVQWLTHHIPCPPAFIEFGVENYRESTTRFLLMNDDWTGLVLDGSAENVAEIHAAEYFWRHELTAKAAFVDRANVNQLLRAAGFGAEIGLLHIDIDGNDYWIWEAIDVVQPVIAVLEYNSVFGPDRAISVPYDPAFVRRRAHPSGLYFGASLPALDHLARKKGYSLVGSNSAGNNAYFVRDDRLRGNDVVRAVPVGQAYVRSRFRESRDARGRGTFLAGDARLEAIRGLPVHDVIRGTIEPL
jgi:hypothetical protein